ncbi:hypothetical protein [Microvirga flavescens]|uniref:hypothetical protein n=1 Tax=Microvirga flavescens TaxID=2249811 RepID=UPI000DDC220C|nr:hypothetical protein [Microvirga flavescens]
MNGGKRAETGRRRLIMTQAMLVLGLSILCTAPILADPSARQTNNCMPKPSACGFPDATNTGVPPGTVLSLHEGDLHITQPGAVVDGLDIVGCVYIEADNVTLKRSRVRGGCPYYAIRTFTASRSVTGVNITDVEIDLRGNLDTKGIAFDGYTATRVHFHNGADCAHFGTNVTIEDSFCDVAPLPDGATVHADGFQSDGGNGITLRHNTIRNPNGQTSAIIMGTNSAPIVNVRIVDNLIAGGGWALYCAAATGTIKDETVSGNRFARTYFPRGGAFGPAAYCERIGAGWAGTNVWDDTGKPF